MKDLSHALIRLAAISLAAVVLAAMAGIAGYGWITRTSIADAGAQVLGAVMGVERSGTGKAHHR